MIKRDSSVRFERLACAVVLLIASSFAAGDGARANLPALPPLPALRPRNADATPPRRERRREQQFTKGQQVEVQLNDGIWRLATVIEPTKAKLKNMPMVYKVSLDAVNSKPKDDWKTTVHRRKIRLADPAHQVGHEVEANRHGTWFADGTTIQKYDEHTGKYTVMLWGLYSKQLRAINIRSIRKFQSPLSDNPLRMILGYAMYDRKVRALCTDKSLEHLYNRDLYKSGIFVRENGISINGFEAGKYGHRFFEMDGFYVAKKYKDELLWVHWGRRFYHGVHNTTYKDASYFVKILGEPRHWSSNYREHYLVAEKHPKPKWLNGEEQEPVWTLCYIDEGGMENVLYRARPGVTEQDLRDGVDCGWTPDDDLENNDKMPRHTLRNLRGKDSTGKLKDFEKWVM